MSASLLQARSLLFVPGNRLERFENAAQSGADAVVLDLEDSVPPHEKVAARKAIAATWPDFLRFGVPIVVRINPEGSATWAADLTTIAKLPNLSAVMLPKAESAETLARVRRVATDVLMLPLIETAAGYAAVQAVAKAPGVLRLAVGYIDFMADTGITCDEHESEMMPLRFAVTMATRLNGLAPAIDGVTVQIGDEARLRQDTLRARRLGFGAKLCIHPSQIAIVHDAFAPTAAEVDWARRVVGADHTSGGNSVQLDGRMIDLPVVLQAKRILAHINGP